MATIGSFLQLHRPSFLTLEVGLDLSCLGSGMTTWPTAYLLRWARPVNIYWHAKKTVVSRKSFRCQLLLAAEQQITLTMISIKPTNPPDGQFDLEYFVGVNGDSVSLETHLSRLFANECALRLRSRACSSAWLTTLPSRPGCSRRSTLRSKGLASSYYTCNMFINSLNVCRAE